MTHRVVAMPQALARNSRRSTPTWRAFSSAFSRMALRIRRSFFVAGRKYSPFDSLPSQMGGSSGSSGSVFFRILSQGSFFIGGSVSLRDEIGRRNAAGRPASTETSRERRERVRYQGY